MLERKILLPEMDCELAANEIGDFMVDRILRFGGTGGVIGLSGGVDSTVTAALAKQAFDRYNRQHSGQPLELVGYILPSDTNNPKDTQDGTRIAEKLGIRHELHSIESIVQAYEATNREALASSYDKANLQSRIRANILSTKAATERKTLLGTGNKDEDFGVGYYTLFGDGAVHMSPIGGLSKRLVRQMARYFGFSEIADREPTAGLEAGQTDFKDLGYHYDVVELLLEGLDQGFSPEQLIKHSQVKPLVKGQIIKYGQMFGSKKFNSVEEVVYDIIGRHEGAALPKAEIIHPPIAPVTLRYGGRAKKHNSGSYRNPYPTSDIIIEFYDGSRDGIVLIERMNPPYGLALPGGFAEWGISLEQNAVKEAKEETGLDIIIESPEKPLCVHSNPERDPRGHMISNTYIAKGSGVLRAGDDAKSARLYTIPEVIKLVQNGLLVFDHARILEKYLKERGHVQ